MSRSLRSILVKTPQFITCRQFEEFITDYTEGNLPIINLIKSYLHLLICEDCRSYIAAYKKSIQMGKAFFDKPDSRVPADMPEELISIVLENMKK